MHGRARTRKREAAAPTELGSLDRRVLAVCDAAGAFIEYWGFKAIFGRVWALLALRHAPMSQAELTQVFGVSRALMSGVMAELGERGLVRQVGEQRNAPYVAVIDVWPTIAEVLRTREWLLLEQARLALEAAVDEAELARSSGRAVAYDVSRMRMLLSMTESAQAFLRMLIGLRVPRGFGSFGGWLSRATELVQTFRRSD